MIHLHKGFSSLDACTSAMTVGVSDLQYLITQQNNSLEFVALQGLKKCFHERVTNNSTLWVTLPESLGSHVLFIDTRPWRSQKAISLPTNEARNDTDQSWFWLSFCGWEKDVWYDGPLARCVGEKILDFVPPLAPCSLALDPNKISTPRSWQSISPQIQIKRHRFLSAASALGAYFDTPPIVGIADGNAYDPTTLVCLAKAIAQPLQVVCENITTDLRKLVLHLGAKQVPSNQSAIDLSKITHLLRNFGNLSEECQELSPIIPGS